MMISKKLNEHLKSIFKPVFAIFSQTGEALTGFGAEKNSSTLHENCVHYDPWIDKWGFLQGIFQIVFSGGKM